MKSGIPKRDDGVSPHCYLLRLGCRQLATDVDSAVGMDHVASLKNQIPIDAAKHGRILIFDDDVVGVGCDNFDRARNILVEASPGGDVADQVTRVHALVK